MHIKWSDQNNSVSLNFAIFELIKFLLGGEPFSGKIINDRKFLVPTETFKRSPLGWSFKLFVFLFPYLLQYQKCLGLFPFFL